MKNNQNSDFIYINGQLTAHNRHLMWLAKNNARETGWKFVWYRNGHIVAKKKNENSSTIVILNACDIELIA